MLKQISQLELTKNEKLVYEYLLKTKEAVASHIAKDLSMDKSSTYIAIKHLFKLGLVIKHFKRRGTTYIASNPEKLKEILLEKKMNIENEVYKLDSIIADLKKKSLNKDQNTNVNRYIGINAILIELEKSNIIKDTEILEVIGDSFKELMNNLLYSKYIERSLINLGNRKVKYTQLVDPSLLNTKKFSSCFNEQFSQIFYLPTDVLGDYILRIYEDNVDILSKENEEFVLIKFKDDTLSRILLNYFKYISKSSIKYSKKDVIPQKILGGKTAISALGLSTDFRQSYQELDKQGIYRAIKQHFSYGINWLDISSRFYSDKELTQFKEIPNNVLIKAKLTHPINTINDVEKQLDNYSKLLNRKYIDIFELESPKLLENNSKLAKELNRLISNGKVNHIGVKNFNIGQLKELSSKLEFGISTNEIEFNLLSKQTNKFQIIDYCNQNGISIIAVNPFKHGILTKLVNDITLNSLVKKYTKTKSQIILNWLYQKENVLILTKTLNNYHLLENIKSFDFILEEEDCLKLDSWEMKEV